MTIHTLIADTNLSSLTLANGDSIALAGWQLTIDNLPTATGIDVSTVGTAGKVAFSGTGVDAQLPTWSFTAGTGPLISLVPSGVWIGTVNGGSASAAYGVNSNTGTVTTANGGSVNGAYGVKNNTGTVTTANGSSASDAYGVKNNYCLVVLATGGSGSSTAYGVFSSWGEVLSVTPGTSRAVGSFSGDIKFIFGPTFNGVFTPSSTAATTTIYSVGAVSGSATIPGDITVIELSEGTSGISQSRVNHIKNMMRHGVSI